MHFASLEYGILLGGVFLLYWAFGRRSLPRLIVLLVASYTFYAWWNPTYLLLIVASTALDFVAGRQLQASTSARSRKRWLMLSLVGNLGLLGIFKYFNFVARSIASVARRLGLAVKPLRLDVALPVGISFYTFQSMSYTIDIFRGALEPTGSALAFAVFVAFFPQLVAGPIVRARYFLPQLTVDPSLDAETGARGFVLIAIGLLKKVVIADLLAVNLVDRVFEMPQLYTSAELLMGLYGYALQIYCDFSAYSDIAIGSGLLLGLQLPDNFDAPYRATDLRDFWRRWHISLSTWLRDYLYIPLGGSRGGAWRTYRNLAITMVLGGLWHGAAWTFVLWGAVHGVGLALTRMWQRRFGGTWRPPGWRLLCVVATFHVVCLGWILFRATDLGDARQMLAGLAQLSGGTANISPMLWGLLLAGFATHAMPDRLVRGLERAAIRLPVLAQAAALVGVVLGVRYLGTTEAVPFIYFQF